LGHGGSVFSDEDGYFTVSLRESCSLSRSAGPADAVYLQCRHSNNNDKRPIMQIRRFADRRPAGAALLVTALQFALTFLILVLGKQLAPAEAWGKVKLAAFASTIVFPLLATHALGLWREVGFDKIRPSAFFLCCLLPVAMFASMGVHLPQGASVTSDLVIQLLNAFGEELLFRGVIFVILLRLPVWQAILLNGVLFGSMHLMHGYMDGNWSHALVWALMSSMAGMMFTAARYRTGSLWLLVLLHMVLNLASMYSNVEIVAGPEVNLMLQRATKAVEFALAAWVMAGAGRRKAAA
jgi:membrane protease YdiL (CAAX protease family)